MDFPHLGSSALLQSVWKVKDKQIRTCWETFTLSLSSTKRLPEIAKASPEDLLGCLPNLLQYLKPNIGLRQQLSWNMALSEQNAMSFRNDKSCSWHLTKLSLACSPELIAVKVDINLLNWRYAKVQARLKISCKPLQFFWWRFYFSFHIKENWT